MTVPRILVIGPFGDEASLCECFAREWRAEKPELAPRLTLQPSYPASLELSSDDVVAFDLVLLFVDPAARSRDTLLLLRQIVGNYPYLPILVLGEPKEFTDRFYALRATRYLRADAFTGAIVREAKNALEATWWSGLQQTDQPTLIVAANGQVIRGNQAARERFGEDIIGKPYLSGVEGDPSPVFGVHHPIHAARTSRRATCRSHPYRQGDKQQHHHLICVPILGLKGDVPAVAVLIEDLDRWMGIFDTSKHLANFDNSEKLHREIVKAAKELGYERVRLFRYDPLEDSLRGVESVGFRADPAFVAEYGMEREEYFRTQFELPLNEDEPSWETKESQLPRLCVHWPGESRPVQGTGPILERYYGHRNCEKILDKGQVSRWIDIPLLVSRGGAGASFWGKLSVDNGSHSDTLDARDVACLTLFAMAAASAIGVVERSESQRRHVELFRTHAQEMAQPPGAHGVTPGYVLKKLSALYQNLTCADEVVYLEWKRADEFRFHDETPRRLSFEEVKQAVRQCGLSERFASQFDHEGTWRGGEAVLSFTGKANDPGEGGSGPWRSTAVIPVVCQRKLRGVFVALSRAGDVFTPARMIAVDHFVDTAGLWFDLAELQHGQRWWDKAIEQILPNMRLLGQTATDDEKFAACLSAILSAGTGLCWNRVFYFSTVAAGVGRGHARLIHAIGGCGEKEHETRQEQATQQFTHLRKLLDLRCNNPVPKDTEGRVDPLYRICVDVPGKAEEPIEIVFNPWDEDNWDSNPTRTAREESPLAWLLERDDPAVSAMPIDLAREPTEWFRQMQSKHPGMFPEPSGKVYAFPLWATYDRRRRPLGLVLVDMLYQPQARLENIIHATRLMLDLAATMLALGCQERLNYGMVRISSMLEHADQLKEDWNFLYRTINQLLGQGIPFSPDRFDALLEQGIASMLEGNAPKRLEEVALDLRSQMEKINQALTRQANTHKALTDQIHRRAKNEIPDVLAHLDGLIGRYNEVAKRKVMRWGSEPQPEHAPSLYCDPLVFDHVFENLIQNATTAAGTDAVEVVIELSVEDADEDLARCGFERTVEIRFTDNGPGISDKKRQRRLFLDGFTCPSGDGAAKKDGKGRGLPLCRAQLRTFHGDLYWQETPADAPLRGATFCLLFGIPTAPTQPQTATDEPASREEPAQSVTPQGVSS